MQRHRALRAVVIAFALVAGLLAGAPIASAHEGYQDVNLCGGDFNNRCGYGGVTNSHTRAYACDTFAEGYGFRTYWTLQNGSTGFVDDANGSDSGCSARVPGTSTNRIVDFDVCWKRQPEFICVDGTP
ncbi:MAG TPA: hypothetical protein VGX25_03240 [Actinophytocola sp.]|uniref:hypothetical protein n=1 Tax=Actinophytocola sp. TaxID=1872138 RepID=UPI002DDD03AA|nr:hypothetical protein [Actinophytocola sp.]HEV2778393.1 hypothetical protein [Actinophytocola sp.]